MGEDPGGVTRRWPWVLACCAVAASTIVAVLVVAAQTDADQVRGHRDSLDGQAADEERADDAPRSLVLQPGEALVNGFVVADDTTVVGGLFPEEPEVIDGAEYVHTRVQVDVPGDLVTAFGAYAEQAEALGYALSAGNADDACWQTLTEPADAAPVGGSTPEPWLMTCAASGRLVAGHTVRTVSISADRTYPSAEGAGEQFRIEFASAPAGSAPSTPPSPPWLAPEPGTGPPRPQIPLEFPGTLDPLCGPALRVVEGSRILSTHRLCTDGYSVVLEVTGSPDDVYGAYVEQLRAVDPEYSLPRSDEFSVDGRGVRVDGAYWDDSSLLEARMIEGDATHAPVLWISFTDG